LERRLWPLASSRSPGHDYNGWHLPRYIGYPPPLPRSSAELRFSSIGPRKGAQSSLVRFILSSPYGACHKSSPKPQIYNSWGNFFEQFSLVSGAAIVYARLSSPSSRETLNRIGRIWAVTTTVLFALAAAALLTNRMALLATRLLCW